MSEERKARIQELRGYRDTLQAQINSIGQELARLDLAQRREEHPCICVKLNRDVEIFDLQEQEARKRVPLGLGLVADTLTARKDCPVCNGTGKPKR